jgi:hypothetical protein
LRNLSKRTPNGPDATSHILACSNTIQFTGVPIAGTTIETARSFYFQVQGNEVYTMLRVSGKPDATCSGPNILDEMRTK